MYNVEVVRRNGVILRDFERRQSSNGGLRPIRLVFRNGAALFLFFFSIKIITLFVRTDETQQSLTKKSADGIENTTIDYVYSTNIEFICCSLKKKISFIRFITMCLPYCGFLN